MPETGPLNQHFVRDIGCAFLVTGVSLVWFALDVRARVAAMAGAAFMTLHALVHVADAMAGREALSRAVFDVPAIYLSALIAIWIAWPQSTPATENKIDDQMAVTATDRRIRKGV